MRYLVLAAALFLSSCSPLDVAGALLGSGPNINGQIGAENTQGIKIDATKQAPTVTVRPKGRVDTIDQRTTNITETDPLMLALLIIGWLAPSPAEIGRRIKSMITRKTDA